MSSSFDLSRQPYVNHIWEVFESAFKIDDYHLNYSDIEHALLKYFAEEDEIAGIFDKESNYWRATSEFIGDALDAFPEDNFSENVLYEDLKLWLDSRLKRHIAHDDKFVLKMSPGGGAIIINVNDYL